MLPFHRVSLSLVLKMAPSVSKNPWLSLLVERYQAASNPGHVNYDEKYAGGVNIAEKLEGAMSESEVADAIYETTVLAPVVLVVPTAPGLVSLLHGIVPVDNEGTTWAGVNGFSRFAPLVTFKTSDIAQRMVRNNAPKQTSFTKLPTLE